MALSEKHCVPCEGGIPPLDPAEITRLLAEVPGWERDGDAIVRSFRFRDFHQTMAFVNAVAWVAHTEDHHPDLAVHYDRCVVRYWTHAAGGLTENDFVCAARVNALADPTSPKITSA